MPLGLSRQTALCVCGTKVYCWTWQQGVLGLSDRLEQFETQS